VKTSIQEKINGIKKLAESSGGDFSVKGKKTSSEQNEDSLAMIITNEKEANNFRADLHASIKMAQETQ
jgi:hypothetical protein